MKKIIVSLLGLVALASADVLFIGAGYGDMENKYVSNTGEYKYNEAAPELRIGVTQQNSRSYLSVSNANVSGTDFTNAVFCLEGLTDKHRLGTGKVQFFVGGNIGIARVSNSGFTETGTLYGAQAGVLITPVKSVGVEFGYRHSFANMDINEFTEMDSSRSIYMAVNFNF